jgi:hypothetical protein
MKLSPKNADTFTRLASYHLAMKNAKDAHICIKIALSIDAEHEEALQLLRDLDK